MAQTPRRLKVAIVGGGIGGLITAISLHHFCNDAHIDIHVYEQAQKYKEIGAGVSLGPNAGRILQKIGLYDPIWAIASKSDIWFSIRRFDNGEEIITLRSNTTDVSHLHVHRAELLDLLMQTVQERKAALLHTGKRCSRVYDNGKTIAVEFQDGETIEADLVLGADGIHSPVRQSFPKEEARYGGMIVYRGVLPVSKLEEWWPFDMYACCWSGRGKYFLVYPISNGTMVNIGAFVTVNEAEVGDTAQKWTMQGDRRDIENYYTDWDPTVHKIIQLMDEKPLKWVLHDHELCDRWVFAGGKAVLLGDAAHAMVPHQGAGAGQAVEDAYVLGRCLGDFLREQPSCGLEEWFTRLYQDIRLPRAQRVQITSRESGENVHMQSKEFDGLSYDESVSLLRKLMETRLKWIWSSDLDAEYEAARERLNK
ncbi:hypothetical protein F5884DRAFT_738131 [Xylogone sp. PMI_703]|nr:hypothetical protein F5884DRAFT_738131 [Xylogone sp. PMI_703]